MGQRRFGSKKKKKEGWHSLRALGWSRAPLHTPFPGLNQLKARLDSRHVHHLTSANAPRALGPPQNEAGTQNCSAKCWLVRGFHCREAELETRKRKKWETEAQHCPTDTTAPLGPAEMLLPHYNFLPGLPRGSVVKHLPADAGDTVQAFISEDPTRLRAAEPVGPSY